jgi:probable HAF family extracellular repeat protein
MWTKAVFASLFVCLISALAVAQSAYTVTDLGPLSPTAINTWGQVVGNYNNKAYIWTFGHRALLGTLPAGTFSSAADINDLGMVTGTADGAGTVAAAEEHSSNVCNRGLVQPFVWTARQGIKGLGTVFVYGLDELPNSCTGRFYATGIDHRGQVVGYTELLPNQYQWAFTWTKAAGMTSFGGSFSPTFINGINRAGLIVGENSMNSDEGHATWWQAGVNLTGLSGGTLLPELGLGYFESSANGVNDLGQIVGWSSTDPSYGDCFTASGDACSMHAVLWSSRGAIIDLGMLPGDTFSSASKINLFGLVIGSSGNTIVREVGGQASAYDGFAEVVGRPFIWTQDSGMQDLNTLIPANSGWVLNSATDINVWGQIVGEGTLNGHPRGFVLTPKRFLLSVSDMEHLRMAEGR